MTHASSALAAALLKLIETVEDENAALRQQMVLQHAGFTDRKNQALRELMAAQRLDGSSRTVPELRPHLKRLSGSLAENANLLKLHIAAVGDISDIIIGSLKDADSDGTYCRNAIPRAR